ncbi:glutamate receptor delta-1 subunit [Elysia marginata]|uniref:Glutamate receptor delta-1 subunit n=1 Tax=Elysia marginata TaxID=1093978 RepID=A0AAV4F2Q6_9GAST|nr:glutamate receptor delta-1 subunit [Elysia marginata]
MKTNRFFVLTVLVLNLTIAVCTKGTSSPIADGYFYTNHGVLKTLTEFQTSDKINSPLWSKNDFNSSRKTHRDKICTFSQNSCNGRKTLVVNDIVRSLQHCGWVDPVVVISDIVLDKDSYSKEVKHGLVKNESIFKRHRSFVHRAAWYAHRNLRRVQVPLIMQDVLRAFHDALLPVQHFQQNSPDGKDLEEIIWMSYNSKRIKNFVWISHKPWEIMHAAQTIFRRHQRGRGALMPHRARFVLIGVESRAIMETVESLKNSHAQSSTCSHQSSSCLPRKSILLKETEKQLADSDFDNVLFLTYLESTNNCEDYHIDCSCFLNEPQTLMWRKNRTREFQLVSNFSFGVSKTGAKNSTLNHGYYKRMTRKQHCELFPNIQTGMNGRLLTFMIKEWFQIMEIKVQGDSVRYTGLINDIATAMSISMNFTYQFFPGPEKSRNTSWKGMRNLFILGGIGDSYFSLPYLTASLAYNFTQAYPIYVINMNGAYVSKPQAQIELFHSKANPIIIIYLVTALVLVILYYSCLGIIAKRWLSGERNQDSTRPLQADSKASCLKGYLYECWHMLFALLGSCFAQSGVPQSSLLSGRILLFFWCLTILTLTSTFQGYLASSLVKVDSSPPFNTFSELVKRKDYRWGHYQGSTFLTVMEAAKGTRTLGALYSGIIRFAKDDPGVLPLDVTDLLGKAASDEKFVAIIDSFTIKLFVNSNGMRNMKVIPDSLGINGMAPAFPRDSELTDLMSEHIIALTDAGIFNLLLDNMLRKLRADTDVQYSSRLRRKDHDGDSPDQKANNRTDVIYALVFSAYMVSGAIAVLSIEIISSALIKCFRRNSYALK